MKKLLAVKSTKAITNYPAMWELPHKPFFKDPYSKKKTFIQWKVRPFFFSWLNSQLLANRDFDLLCLLSALEAWRHVAEKDNLTSSDLAEVGLSYHPPTVFNVRNTQANTHGKFSTLRIRNLKIGPKFSKKPGSREKLPQTSSLCLPFCKDILHFSEAPQAAPVANPLLAPLVRLQMMERHEAQILSQGADEINTESQMCGVSGVGTFPSLKGFGRQKREEVDAICRYVLGV